MVLWVHWTCFWYSLLGVSHVVVARWWFWGSVLAQAALTKYCKLGGLNRYLFITVLDGETSKIKVLANLDLEGLLSLQMTTFWLCAHIAFPCSRDLLFLFL